MREYHMLECMTDVEIAHLGTLIFTKRKLGVKSKVKAGYNISFGGISAPF